MLRLAAVIAAIFICGLLLRGITGRNPAEDSSSVPVVKDSASTVRKPVKILISMEATSPLVSVSIGESGTSLFEWSGSDYQLSGEFEIPARDGSDELMLRALPSPDDKLQAKALRVWTSVLGRPGNETIFWLLPGESEFVGVLPFRIHSNP